YADLRAPLQEVGVMLDGRTVHPGRTAWGHLMGLARTHGIGRARVQQVIELAGLTSVARRRVGGFSLGMTQRLGIAAALLGDPPTVVLDEPVNRLDPDGVLWIRGLLRSLADDGRTVFLSSHLMSELAAVANRVVVIGRGALLADDDIDALVTRSARDGVVRVRPAEPERLGRALAAAGATVRPVDGDLLEVTGTDAGTVGALAAELGVPVLELGTVAGTLEEAYLDLTADAVEYGGTGARAAGGDRSWARPSRPCRARPASRGPARSRRSGARPGACGRHAGRWRPRSCSTPRCACSRRSTAWSARRATGTASPTWPRATCSSRRCRCWCTASSPVPVSSAPVARRPRSPSRRAAWGC